MNDVDRTNESAIVLGQSCYRFLETWTVVARHLAKTGLAAQAEASLRSGQTVRALFRELYGSKAGLERDPAMERSVGSSSGRCGEPTALTNLGGENSEGVRRQVPDHQYYISK